MDLQHLINNADIPLDAFSEKFGECFKLNGIDYTFQQIKYFYVYYLLLKSENSKYNLTSITEANEVIAKHFADSLLPLKFFSIEDKKIIDIGTGAGFPVMPLFLQSKQAEFLMLDSSNKKINFLREFSKFLQSSEPIPGFSKLNFHCGRAEEAARLPEFNCKFDLVVSRALANISALCELSAAFLKQGGFLAAYKGKNAGAELADFGSAYKKLGFASPKVYEYELKSASADGARNLILFEKTGKTPEIYPRQYAKIKKFPL